MASDKQVRTGKRWKLVWMLRLVVMLVLALVVSPVVGEDEVRTFVSSLAFSSDSNLLAVGHATKGEGCYREELYTVDVFDIAQERLNLPRYELRATCNVNGLIFVNGNQELLGVTKNSWYVRWRLDDEEIANVTLWGGTLKRLRQNTSTGNLIIASTDEIILIQEDVKSIPLERLHDDELTDVDWSPDESLVVTSSLDATVHVWNATTEKTIVRSELHDEAPTSVAWNPISDTIASADESGVIYVWNAVTGETIATTSTDAAINDLVWSPDGRLFATAGEDGLVRVWQVEGSELIERTGYDYGAPVYALAWSPDGTKLAYGGMGVDGADGEVAIVEVDEVVLTPTATFD